jgi:hypothetical protein
MDLSLVASQISTVREHPPAGPFNISAVLNEKEIRHTIGDMEILCVCPSPRDPSRIPLMRRIDHCGKTGTGQHLGL